MGAFDRDPGIRPSARYFVAYAVPWEPIPDDGLPRFEEKRAKPRDRCARLACSALGRLERPRRGGERAPHSVTKVALGGSDHRDSQQSRLPLLDASGSKAPAAARAPMHDSSRTPCAPAALSRQCARCRTSGPAPAVPRPRSTSAAEGTRSLVWLQRGPCRPCRPTSLSFSVECVGCA
jgi:hypothetical protein